MSYITSGEWNTACRIAELQESMDQRSKRMLRVNTCMIILNALMAITAMGYLILHFTGR